MRRILIGWGVIVLTLFLGSTVTGMFVNSVMQPREQDHGRQFGVAPVAPVVSRTFTQFQAVAKLEPHEKKMFEDTIQEIVKYDRKAKVNFPIHLFNLQRMAEEEIPLGVYVALGVTPYATTTMLAQEDIRINLQLLAQTHTDLLPDGTPELVRLRRSADRLEALAIVKHTITKEEKVTVEFRRWWFKWRQQGGAYDVYDFDYPNTRLRFLSARMNLLNKSIYDHPGNTVRRGTQLGNRDAVEFKRYSEVVELLNRASTADELNESETVDLLLNETCNIPLVREVQLANDIACMRIGIACGQPAVFEKHASRIEPSGTSGPIPIFGRVCRHNAKNQYLDALKAIKQYRDLVGDDTCVYLEEAKALAATKGEAAAIEALRKGLTVFPNDEGLTRELARREEKQKATPKK